MSFRGAIVSVGGSEQPIIVNLSLQRPEFVLFFVSADSRKEVDNKILPALDPKPQYNIVQTPNPGDLAECYEVLRNEIPRWMADRGLDPGAVYVDITGATKPMSAGLAMAAAEWFQDFAYVSGKERDKAGLGVVISGTEFVLFTSNPWDKLASRERERATWLFRSRQAEAAAIWLRNAAAKCSNTLKEELRALADIASLFAEADRFHLDSLAHGYNKIRGELKQIFSRRGQVATFEELEKMAMHWRHLRSEAEAHGDGIEATLRELVANAERRFQQARYDDAIARLYRAAELFVQGRLAQAFGARLGDVLLDQIPAERRAEFQAEFGPGDKYKLGLENGFNALRYCLDPGRREVAGRYETIKQHLQKRNDSILAHGLRPASEADFKLFWEALLPVVEVRKEDIPRWPELEF